ncbi:hypothetical protein, partial [Nonomuraea aridisoli]|uniref:hypothetical protein n=1 Tax=Nonomuraea aridisoli TaxID=2070368 RepID=UPI001C6467C8
MRPDDPPQLPDEHLPYPGYEGPRGFADVDGGYPVEKHVTEAAQPDRRGPQAPEDAEADAPGPPASPRTGRLLHNPLPPVEPPDSDDAWYGPEPERANWRMIAPIAVLLACAGLGVWLAFPSSTEQNASVPAPSSPSVQRTLTQRPAQDPATRWPTPTRLTPAERPATRRPP